MEFEFCTVLPLTLNEINRCTNNCILFPHYRLRKWRQRYVQHALNHALLIIQPSLPDADTLNCALTIEHLELALYNQGLSRFSVNHFVDAGLEPWIYSRLQEIAEHERTHVDFLTGTLKQTGRNPVQSCTYNLYVGLCPCYTVSHINLSS